MAQQLSLEIVTPERKLYANTVAFVSCPAAEGEIGILPMHEAFVSTLKAGEVRVKTSADAQPLRFVIAGGYIQVKDDLVLILADHARSLDDIDQTAVRKRLEECIAKLEGLDPKSESYLFLQEEQLWYETQLRLLAS